MELQICDPGHATGAFNRHLHPVHCVPARSSLAISFWPLVWMKHFGPENCCSLFWKAFSVNPRVECVVAKIPSVFEMLTQTCSPSGTDGQSRYVQSHLNPLFIPIFFVLFFQTSGSHLHHLYISKCIALLLRDWLIRLWTLCGTFLGVCVHGFWGRVIFEKSTNNIKWLSNFDSLHDFYSSATYAWLTHLGVCFAFISQKWAQWIFHKECNWCSQGC